MTSQQFFGLSNPSRSRTLTRWQFATVRNENVPGSVERAMSATLAWLDRAGHVPTHPSATE